MRDGFRLNTYRLATGQQRKRLIRLEEYQHGAENVI